MISENQIDQLYQTIETEKSSVLNKMKENNIDAKELHKLNKLFGCYCNVQTNLLRLRQLIKKELE